MTDPGPIESPLAERLRELRGAPLTVGVWLAAVVAVVVLLGERSERVLYTGLAQVRHFEVASLAEGRIEHVLVDLYETVDVGDIVAVVDPGPILARLATADAELERLEVELAAVTAGGAPDVLDWQADMRRFESESANRLLEQLRIDVQIESDQVEAQRLDARLRRVTVLHTEGVVSDQEFDEVRLRHRTVTTRIEENKILRAGTREQYLRAREREERFAEGSPVTESAGLVAPLRAALEVQRRRVDELRIEREQLVLRSPVAGRVSAVLAGAGEVVLTGDPVLTMARTVVTEVLAYARADRPDSVIEGQPVLLARASDPTAAAESVVLRVSPTVEAVPERLWTVPGRPEYGRAFVVAAATPLRLVPDEPVRVRLLPID